MSAHLQSEAAFESGILGFISRQWFNYRKPVPAGTSLAGQTAIITGANIGLGLETSRQFLQLGLSRLIVAVRSEKKGEDAAKSLRASFPQANIEVWLVDMVSYDSVRSFAKKCETLDRIDIVILNAGLQSSTYTYIEATGHEQCIQVNYLSTALLAILLLPILRSKGRASSKPPVLSIVTSDTAYWTSLEGDRPILPQLDTREGYSEFKQYTGTKLLEMFFVTKLTEHVNADEVLVNMVSPGFTGGTSLQRGNSGTWNPFFGLFKAIMTRNVEVGASTYVDATVVQGKESHGSFCSEWAIRP